MEKAAAKRFDPTASTFSLLNYLIWFVSIAYLPLLGPSLMSFPSITCVRYRRISEGVSQNTDCKETGTN